jgi:hypothetical protein
MANWFEVQAGTMTEAAVRAYSGVQLSEADGSRKRSLNLLATVDNRS